MTFDPLPDAKETLPRRPRQAVPFTGQQALFCLGIVAFVVLAFGAIGLTYLLLLTQRTPVTVFVDNQAIPVNARAATVGQLLSTLDITLQPGDQLSAALEAPLEAGLMVRVERARNVSITLDEATRIYRTVLANPAEILAQAGYAPTADDRLVVDGTLADLATLATWPVPVSEIAIYTRTNVTIDDNGQQQTARVGGRTVGDALFEAGITLYEADSVVPAAGTALTPEMRIQITRSAVATVVADGRSVPVRTQAANVGELLAAAGVPLFGLDYSIPAEDVPVQSGMTVRIIRVSEDVTSTQEVMPFESVYQADPALELDQLRILQPGRSGLRRQDTYIRYENGVEVERAAQASVVVQTPQNRVVAYGAGIVVRTVDTEEGTREYWRKIRMLATSYHPAALGGDNVTATGRILTKGIVAIDPGVIPYGTQVFVPGYGMGLAADTGGPRSTRRWIDLGYDDENFVPWARWVDVYILAPVPANVQYVLPE